MMWQVVFADKDNHELEDNMVWRIAELITLEPFDKTPVPSQQPVIAALEMPRGWFAKYGVAVGQKVTLRP